MSSILDTPCKNRQELSGQIASSNAVFKKLTLNIFKQGVRKKVIWEMGPEGVASVRLRKEQRVERRQGIHCY